MRGLITELQEEYAETFLFDLGIQCRTARRLLKPLAEQFSSQPQHSFLLLVGLSGGDGDLSEASSTVLRGRVEDLNYKAEKVSVKVEIFVKLFGIMLLFNVRRVLEDSRRVEEELVFTVRNQKV